MTKIYAALYFFTRGGMDNSGLGFLHLNCDHILKGMLSSQAKAVQPVLETTMSSLYAEMLASRELQLGPTH